MVVEEMTSVKGVAQYKWVGVVRVTGSCVLQSDSKGVVMTNVAWWTLY